MLGITGIAVAGLLTKIDQGVVSLFQNLLPSLTQKDGGVHGGQSSQTAGIGG